MSLLGLNKLAGKIAGAIGAKYAVSRLKDAAEGKLGDGWKKAYWALAGKKRVVGILMVLVSLFVFGMGYPDAGAFLGVVSGVMISAGMVDDKWREEAISDIQHSRVYVFLASNAGECVLVYGILAKWINECSQQTVEILNKIYLDCGSAEKILAALSVVSLQLGLNFAASKASGPVKNG